MSDLTAPTGLGVSSSLPDNEFVDGRPESELGSPTASPALPSALAKPRPIGRDALIYGIGMVLTRAASFIMLPIYTRLLTTADYGLLQMLDMTVDVISLLVSAGCVLGVMRFYFKASDDKGRQAIISTAFVLQVGLNLLGTLLLFAIAVPVWKHALNGAGTAWYVRIAAANFTLGALSVVPLLYMQIQGRVMMYTITSLSKLLLQLSLNIVFLVILRKGPGGILLSTMIANIIVGCASTLWLLRVNGFRFTRSAATDLRRFGIPYQFATAGNFVLVFGDRFFLQPTHGLAAVGIYSFAYQFGFLMYNLGIGPYSQAWVPQRYEIAAMPAEERDRAYNSGFFYLSLIAITVAVGIAIFAHPTLRIMSRSEFLPAADLVPIILAAYVIQGWGETAQFGINVSEKTQYSTYAVWISVVVVVLLYILLIPRFGGLGAAIATVAGFSLRTALFFLFAQRLWPVNYTWAPHVKLAVLASGIVIASYFLRSESLVREISLACALTLCYAGITWAQIVTPGQRADILGAASRQVARMQAVVLRA